MRRKSDAVFDYAIPYDIMIGFWAGIAIIYNPKGEYQGSMASHLATYWEKRFTRLHFRQTELTGSNKSLDRYALKKPVSGVVIVDFDFHINGKRGTGVSGDVHITGTQTRPDHYHFLLKSEDGQWYNNHHFMGPNERHILGPFVSAGRDGEIESVVAQTFTRLSYDVPKEFRYDVAIKSKREAR
jgi:hypothetical protein